MERNDDEIFLIKQKADLFKEKNIAVHIIKNNNWFHNGTITSIDPNFLMLNDEIDGEIPIFFMEIYEIEKRVKKI